MKMAQKKLKPNKTIKKKAEKDKTEYRKCIECRQPIYDTHNPSIKICVDCQLKRDLGVF